MFLKISKIIIRVIMLVVFFLVLFLGNIVFMQVVDGNTNIYANEELNEEKFDIQKYQTGENTDTNKYLYNQLEMNSKIIYNILFENKDNMTGGTYIIQLGQSFDKVLKEENGNKQLGMYYQAAMEAFLYDNPDVFYIDASKMYLNIETTTRGSQKSYNVFINSGNESNYLAEGFETGEDVLNAQSQINQVISEIENQDLKTDYEKIEYVHNYIIDNTQYDKTLEEENIYDVYGTLINNVAVCEGYAKTFKLLLDTLDVPNIVVIGKATNSLGLTESHAWNYVLVDNQWYGVDTTWDDPISLTGYVSEESKTAYLLKGSDIFSEKHRPEGQFTPQGHEFQYVELSQTNY